MPTNLLGIWSYYSEENARLRRAPFTVILNINNSALTHNDPLDGSPEYMHFTTKNGETRTFQYGSRATNPIDQWPDRIFTHISLLSVRHFPVQRLVTRTAAIRELRMVLCLSRLLMR